MIIILDFETYYDKDYSLRKLKTAEYVYDDRFQVHQLGIKIDDSGIEIIAGDDVEDYLQSIPWSEATVVGHNLSFDGLILNHHYKISPRWWFDTLGAANAILPSHYKKKLNDVAQLLGAPQGKLKGLEQTKGKRILTEKEYDVLATYCEHDVRLTYFIYNVFKDILPVDEQYLLHATTRMAAEPVLELDIPLLESEVQRLKLQRDEAITKSPIGKTVLSSDKQFAEWLVSQNIDLPMKMNAKETAEIPALSQNDLGYQILVADHPELDSVWGARKLVKSTIELTRTESFLNIGRHGLMPMPLKYYGAHTGRWSGADGLNVQNLPRGGALRLAITAPNNYQIIVYDLSQIELRVNAWFCDQTDVLDVLRSGDDIYCHAATKHFGWGVTKADTNERAFGKMLTLALGYQMGWRKLQTNAKIGFMGTPKVDLDDAEAQMTVNKWRSANPNIKQMWDNLQGYITNLIGGNKTTIKCVTIRKDGIDLPNGMTIQYDNARYIADEFGKTSAVYGNNKYLYGGIILENIVQALARIVVAEQLIEVDQHPDIQVVSSTHDEIIAIAPTSNIDATSEFMKNVMSKPPKWAPDLPIECEGGFAKNYSK
jgi:DNA polymerase